MVQLDSSLGLTAAPSVMHRQRAPARLQKAQTRLSQGVSLHSGAGFEPATFGL